MQPTSIKNKMLFLLYWRDLSNGDIDRVSLTESPSEFNQIRHYGGIILRLCEGSHLSCVSAMTGMDGARIWLREATLLLRGWAVAVMSLCLKFQG